MSRGYSHKPANAAPVNTRYRKADGKTHTRDGLRTTTRIIRYTRRNGKNVTKTSTVVFARLETTSLPFSTAKVRLGSRMFELRNVRKTRDKVRTLQVFENVFLLHYLQKQHITYTLTLHRILQNTITN